MIQMISSLFTSISGEFWSVTKVYNLSHTLGSDFSKLCGLRDPASLISRNVWIRN